MNENVRKFKAYCDTVVEYCTEKNETSEDILDWVIRLTGIVHFLEVTCDVNKEELIPIFEETTDKLKELGIESIKNSAR